MPLPETRAVTEEQVFLAALDLPDAAARAAYLDEACGGDAEFRRQVEALLAAHFRSGAVPGRAGGRAAAGRLRRDDVTVHDAEMTVADRRTQTTIPTSCPS